MTLFDSREALHAAVANLPDDVARVSHTLPLRANLSAQGNIALIPLYQRHLGAAESDRLALALLTQLGHADLAPLRDPDMQPAQRFVTQLARALMLERPRLVIDQPGAMLYDVPYPRFIRELAARSASNHSWEIYDFSWNRTLYPE